MRNDRGVKLLSRNRRRTAQLTGSNLGVLRIQGADNINRRQVVVVQLVRIHPDTHRVLRTKYLGITHAFGTADRVFDGR